MTSTVAALTLAGCSGSATTALPPGPPTAAGTAGAASPTASPTPAADPVLTAYLAYWDTVIAANAKADPAYGALARVAAEPQLGRVRATVSRNRIQKLSLRGEVGHAPKPAAVRGATATLEDCYDISGWNPVNLTTGERVDVTEEGGTGRYRARYTLRRSGGRWLVADQRALGGC